MAGLSRRAVECFRLSSSGMADATQIHTPMCYAELNDVIEQFHARAARS